MTIFLENSPARIIRRHPLVKMIECPGKEGEEGWDIMTGGSNKISHKYTLTNTYKALHGKVQRAWVDTLRNLHDKQ